MRGFSWWVLQHPRLWTQVRSLPPLIAVRLPRSLQRSARKHPNEKREPSDGKRQKISAKPVGHDHAHEAGPGALGVGIKC